MTEFEERFLQASEHCDCNAIKEYIKCGLDLNIKNERGKTALIIASGLGFIEILRLLIDAGTDINAIDADGYTGLMRASLNGSVRIVKLLIENKANLDVQNKDGTTPLIYASYYGYTEIATLLIKSGANIYIENKERKSAFDIAKEELDKSNALTDKIKYQKIINLLESVQIDKQLSSIEWEEVYVI